MTWEKETPGPAATGSGASAATFCNEVMGSVSRCITIDKGKDPPKPDPGSLQGGLGSGGPLGICDHKRAQPFRALQYRGRVSKVFGYPQGIEVEALKSVWSGKLPPKREEGDVSGWSLKSRRRLREHLLRTSTPEGWSVFGADLTIPPHPVGHPSPCASREECGEIWKRFADRMNRAGVACVWRREVQPRTSTDREDIRGVEQPHWHCIGAIPPGCDYASIRGHWLSSLGGRGEVKGAATQAARIEDVGAYESARRRYLFDHASKRKQEQIAKGWGRHWGIIGRDLFEDLQPMVWELDEWERVCLLRLLRRLTSRRVPDRRATGGIDWGKLQVTPYSAGVRVSFVGGSVVCRGWDGQGVPSVEHRRAVCRALGAVKRNVWALRLAPCRRRGAGQWFGVSPRIVEAARIVAASGSPPAFEDQGAGAGEVFACSDTASLEPTGHPLGCMGV